jgi:serine/threonine protein kinase
VKFVVKLADVEFASVGETPEHMTRGDTPNWTAPEVLNGTATVSPASDMYALANVLFEIAARELPFGATPGGGSAVRQLIVNGHRPEFPDSASLSAADLADRALTGWASFAAGSSGRPAWSPPAAADAEAERLSRQQFAAVVAGAWAHDPLARPTAEELVAQLQALHTAFVQQAAADKDQLRRVSFLPFKAHAAVPLPPAAVQGSATAPAEAAPLPAAPAPAPAAPPAPGPSPGSESFLPSPLPSYGLRTEPRQASVPYESTGVFL